MELARVGLQLKRRVKAKGFCRILTKVSSDKLLAIRSKNALKAIQEISATIVRKASERALMAEDASIVMQTPQSICSLLELL